MNKFYSIFLLCFCSFSITFRINAQKIDCLKSKHDIETFVRMFDYENPYFNKIMRDFKVISLDSMYSHSEPEVHDFYTQNKNIKLWQIGDFDSNGMKDLWIYGDPQATGISFMCFFTFKNGIRYSSINSLAISNHPSGINNAIPKSTSAKQLVVYNFSSYQDVQKDTLVPLLGRFIEKKAISSSKQSKKSLVLQTSNFSIEVKKSGYVILTVTKKTSSYRYSHAFDPDLEILRKEGLIEYTPSTLLGEKILERGNYILKNKQCTSYLLTLIRFVNWHNFNKNYSTGVSEGDYYRLEIAESNKSNQVNISIKDDGCKGSYTLSHIYDIIYQIISSGDWRKIR